MMWLIPMTIMNGIGICCICLIPHALCSFEAGFDAQQHSTQAPTPVSYVCFCPIRHFSVIGSATAAFSAGCLLVSLRLIIVRALGASLPTVLHGYQTATSSPSP